MPVWCVMETLLECFRDPESTATDEERALRLLTRYLHHEQARDINIKDLEQGIDCRLNDRYQPFLLHYACGNTWYDVSRELVGKHQCDPHLVSKWKYTPLHFACKGGSISIVRFLIFDHHCDPGCCGGRVELHCILLVRVGNWTLSSFFWRSATVTL